MASLSIPMAKPNRGQTFRPAAHQTIISATTTHSTLGSQRICNPFEHGFTVVIESPDDHGIHPVRLLLPVEYSSQMIKVSTGFIVQKVRQQRCIRQQCLCLFHFAVKNSQWIGLKTSLAVPSNPVRTPLRYDTKLAISASGGSVSREFNSRWIFPSIPSACHILRVISNSSASISASAMPKHSTPICSNCRYRPFWGRSYRNRDRHTRIVEPG